MLQHRSTGLDNEIMPSSDSSDVLKSSHHWLTSRDQDPDQKAPSSPQTQSGYYVIYQVVKLDKHKDILGYMILSVEQAMNK